MIAGGGAALKSRGGTAPGVRRGAAIALRRGPDRLLLAATLFLVVFGLTMVLSASATLAASQGFDPGFFARRQAFRALIGIAAMAIAYATGPERIRRLAPIALVAIGILLLALLVPSLRGEAVRSTHRWHRALGLTVQPAELVKVALILHLARLLAARGASIATLRGLAAPLVLLLGVCLVVAKQPALGTAVAIGLSGSALVFIAGARLRHLLLVAAAGAGGVLLRLAQVPYEAKRLTDFLAGHPDPQGSGYQLRQSLIALGSGGLFGQGLGGSMQKNLFLPDPHTDFIFAIVGEEGGFILAGLVLAAYALLVARGFEIARAHPDRFGALAAAGLAAMVAVHVLLNLAVVTGLAPTTGLPLPLLSYGGSSLVVNLAAVGILLRLSAERRGAGAVPAGEVRAGVV